MTTTLADLLAACEARLRLEYQQEIERLKAEHEHQMKSAADAYDKCSTDYLNRAEKAEQQRNEAYGYLTRLFRLCAPQCEPDDDLLTLCTQIDNYIVGVKQQRDEALALLRLARDDGQLDLDAENWARVEALLDEVAAPRKGRALVLPDPHPAHEPCCDCMGCRPWTT